MSPLQEWRIQRLTPGGLLPFSPCNGITIMINHVGWHPSLLLWSSACASIHETVWRLPPGVGVTKPISPFRYLSNFSALSKHTISIDYNVYIRKASPQLRYGDSYNLRNNCAISKILVTDKLTNGALVTPTPDLVRSRNQRRMWLKMYLQLCCQNSWQISQLR